MERINHLLLFGRTGAIGTDIAEHFRCRGWRVTGITRKPTTSTEMLCWNPLDRSDRTGREKLATLGPFDAICWAQGQNCNDSVFDFDLDNHEALYRANVLYILSSLSLLLKHGHLAKPARLCVISSIWQEIARQDKLSYCTTKSALHGLVLSAASDLARDGHLINAVLPGALETPMTHRNLNPEQLSSIVDATRFKRLPSLGDVASTVYFLCSEANTGLTGQFVKVDLGFSNVRVI